MRFVIAVLITGSVLAVGQWLPILGLDPRAVAWTIAVCTGREVSLFWPFHDVVCHGPQLLHQQAGGQALLGTVALVTAIALWVRRRLAR